MEKIKENLKIVADLIEQAEDTRDMGFIYMADEKVDALLQQADEQIKLQGLIAKENKALKHRCAAVSKGLLCIYCPMVCDYRSAKFEGKNEK